MANEPVEEPIRITSLDLPNCLETSSIVAKASY